MRTPKNISIALYDATAELELYGNASVSDTARSLGKSLGEHGFTLIFRPGSPVINTVVTSSLDAYPLALSPAATSDEHTRVFRLPHSDTPTVFTGRGALRVDVMLAESAHGIIICGSDEEALDGILGCIGIREIPIAIYTKENEQAVRERVIARYKELLHHFFVTDNAEELVREFVSNIRNNHLKDF